MCVVSSADVYVASRKKGGCTLRSFFGLFRSGLRVAANRGSRAALMVETPSTARAGGRNVGAREAGGSRRSSSSRWCFT